ncbi:hypothetical protein CDL12_25260 [Handroanthus impetiginosus]|uniref:Uncharacterized protein n=1 Tax=Handroanthus impetiginosus TaxID=429701 RepID=A0A2G9GAI3_9LAMI|nr:hypothetical protein CDL12_25260 [Handroanthus impetiginosus]
MMLNPITTLIPICSDAEEKEISNAFQSVKVTNFPVNFELKDTFCTCPLLGRILNILFALNIIYYRWHFAERIRLSC